MIAESYDAVIVGGSFGGLAAAGALVGSGRILVIDREPIGTGQTSACGTLLAVLERLDALAALEQVHPEIVVNVAGRRMGIRPPYPFATFDYRTLCEILRSRLDGVEIVVAHVDGAEDGGVIAGGRRFTAPVFIDASGWRAVLARGLGGPEPNRSSLSFGLETRHGHGGCDLEFWVRPPDEPDGVYWAFPAGDHVREGVASYAGIGRGLRGALGRFAHEAHFEARAVHGGFFPSQLREPVTGSAFVVGDAAGQCLPLTGEGVRPALVWGQEAGRHARGVLDGSATLDQALGAYRASVRTHRHEYCVLQRLQHALMGAPLALLPTAVRVFASGPVGRFAQRSYWAVADPDTLEVRPGMRSRTTADRDKCEPAPSRPGTVQPPVCLGTPMCTCGSETCPGRAALDVPHRAHDR